MQANGDLIENWAFGIVAWLALATFLGCLAVLGITALVVHLRVVRRTCRLQDEEDLKKRIADADRLLR